jgi:hypothetical protein
MPIRENILKVKHAMLAEIDVDDHPFCDLVEQNALRAVSKGQGSPEWKKYMTMFVDNEAALNDPQSISSRQLARLIGTDNTANNPVYDEKRAYLAADGTCTTETTTNFGRNASVVLDQEPQP